LATSCMQGGADAISAIGKPDLESYHKVNCANRLIVSEEC